MTFDRETATRRARQDLAGRLNVPEGDIEVASVEEKEFSDMSLGAAVGGEMAAQMIASGWSINLSAGGQNYEYRGDKYQLRLVGYDGANHMIESY